MGTLLLGIDDARHGTIGHLVRESDGPLQISMAQFSSQISSSVPQLDGLVR